ncbi:MAG: hypothetical protein ABL308_06420 [Oceanicaulis sp.]
MSADQTTACARLGVDAFGLDRLIAQGHVAATRSREGWKIEPGELNRAADALARRRAEALDRLAKLDGPHL